jgi:citrate synthase
MTYEKQHEIVSEYVRELCDDIRGQYAIAPAEFGHGNIKRGLRNSDGTGVYAGVTSIGSVQGYVVQDSNPLPMTGRLYYRGIDIMDIANAQAQGEALGYEEVAYLLLFGKLPTAAQLAKYNSMLSAARQLPDNFTEDTILKAPGSNIMNKLARCVLTLYSYDPAPDDTSIENVVRQSIELIGRTPVIIAHCYAAKRHYFDKESLFIHVPQEGLSLAGNFLHLLRRDNRFTHEEARVLDLMLILHAEHGGGNNSTFACRVLSSTNTDTYAALAASLGSLKGPLHGGANVKVMEMFRNIRDHVSDLRDSDEVYAYLLNILDKKANDGSGKIYGLGHAVYTESDPRAIILKQYVRNMSVHKGLTEDFILMETIEAQGIRALSERASHKVMCANVDMYSGLVYQMLGIPEELYTPLFAAARMAGWCAHRIEELVSGGRIIRPAYRAVNHKTPYIPLAERG